MTGTKLASRYSRSLILLAIERGELNEVFSDMKLIAKTCRENRELALLLRSPIIKTDKKRNILHAIFGDKINRTSQGFLDIITNKRREFYLEKIAEAFAEQYKQTNHIVTATVTTTMPLDKTLKEKILELVNSKTNQGVELIEKTDDKLIGGFVLRIGDNQIDSSIQRKLNDLRKNFSENPYVKEF